MDQDFCFIWTHEAFYIFEHCHSESIYKRIRFISILKALICIALVMVDNAGDKSFHMVKSQQSISSSMRKHISITRKLKRQLKCQKESAYKATTYTPKNLLPHYWERKKKVVCAQQLHALGKFSLKEDITDTFHRKWFTLPTVGNKVAYNMFMLHTRSLYNFSPVQIFK